MRKCEHDRPYLQMVSLRTDKGSVNFFVCIPFLSPGEKLAQSPLVH
jgi:hypothetical protein